MVSYYLPFRDDLVGEYHDLPFVRSGSVPEEAEKVEPVLQILSLEASVCPEERFDAAMEVVDRLHRILRVRKPLRGAARIAYPLASHRLDQPVIGRLAGSAADAGAVQADSLHPAVLVWKHFDFQNGRYAEQILRKARLEPSLSFNAFPPILADAFVNRHLYRPLFPVPTLHFRSPFRMRQQQLKSLFDLINLKDKPVLRFEACFPLRLAFEFRIKSPAGVMKQ